ncbi:MAG: hypothetical protein ACLUJG_18820 [Lawsonibacter sp.]
MPKRRHRFQAPPAQDPLHGARSSLVFRLNFGFFFRQLGIFFVMDLLLVIMATTGLFLWAENRCADVVALVDVRGCPPQTPSPGWRPAITASPPWTGSPRVSRSPSTGCGSAGRPRTPCTSTT